MARRLGLALLGLAAAASIAAAATDAVPSKPTLLLPGQRRSEKEKVPALRQHDAFGGRASKWCCCALLNLWQIIAPSPTLP